MNLRELARETATTDCTAKSYEHSCEIILAAITAAHAAGVREERERRYWDVDQSTIRDLREREARLRSLLVEARGVVWALRDELEDRSVEHDFARLHVANVKALLAKIDAEVREPSALIPCRIIPSMKSWTSAVMLVRRVPRLK